MKTLLVTVSVVVLSIVLAREVRADSDGADILPFGSPGGAISGVVEVNPDGSATIKGQIQGVPFAGSGTCARNPDGSWTFSNFLADMDLMARLKPWILEQINFTGDEEDATDGDPSDDDVGTAEVSSPTGMGKGEIQLNG